MGQYRNVKVTLYPAPRGAGITGPPIVKKLLYLGGVKDCYTSATNYTSVGPLAKATFFAIKNTYYYIPPDAHDESDPKFTMHWRFLQESYVKKVRQDSGEEWYDGQPCICSAEITFHMWASG